MRTSTRILSNSIITIGRMLCTVGIGLAITRMVFRTLGTVDFGIFSAVAALAFALPLIGGALADGCQRHFAHAIGRGDREALQAYIAGGMVLFTVVAICLGGTLWAIEPWLLHRLTIPADRLAAAGRTYEFALLLALITVMSTTSRALIQAHEHFGALAIMEILSRVITLIAACLLTRAPGDRLVWWAGLQAAAGLAQWSLQFAFVARRLPHCRPSFKGVNRAILSEMVAYMSGTLLVQASGQARTLGTALVVNVYYGPSANALLTIGSQLVGYAQQIIAAFQGVVTPTVIRIYASAGLDSALRIALSANKMALTIFAGFGAMLVAWHTQILRAWLGTGGLDQDMRPIVAVLLLSWGVAYLSFGVSLLTQAFGRPLRPYAITSAAEAIAAATTVAVPLFIPSIAIWQLLTIPIFTTFVSAFAYTAYESRRIGFPFEAYWRSFFPRSLACVLIAVSLASGGSWLVRNWHANLTLSAVGLPLGIASGLAVFLRIGLDAAERREFARLAQAIAVRIGFTRAIVHMPQIDASDDLLRTRSP